MIRKKRNLDGRDSVYIGVLSAMCAVATAIKIPFGVGAMVHLGTAFLFMTAIVFGGVYAGLSGAIGSALYDLVLGFSPYTLWSFFIKGVAGLIAGLVAKGKWPETAASAWQLRTTWFLRAFLGCLLAAVWTLGGYIAAWWQVTGSLATALANIPSSLMTSGAGLVIALLVSPKLRKLLS
ncbi:ecf-type riboflavin transporter s component [Lucifera butyrica]|uniref:Ecf-type riboflavin transporter s component n=1 Tax=Lucifera butyrica TaxID=1351585 RepID=A0A498R5M2_9FIRM|nr:ECF transporter S component [Lucifera butyrica]VBB06754.1 ecf-type riboflavin transporter s component [Lucifera butyrica]